MGLAMFAFKTLHKPKSKIGFTVPENMKSVQMFCWIKEGNLDYWMQKLYEKNGGKEEFNRINLLLSTEDLYQLQKELPSNESYFVKYCSQEEIAEYLHFVDVALKAINEGYTIYYKNSW